MLFLHQLLILPFSGYKLATTCQIDPNKVSNSNLTVMIESTAPPQQPHKRDTVYLGHLVNYNSFTLNRILIK